MISRFAPMMAEKISICPSLLRNAIWNATSSHPVNTVTQHVTAHEGPLKSLGMTTAALKKTHTHKQIAVKGQSLTSVKGPSPYTSYTFSW